VLVKPYSYLESAGLALHGMMGADRCVDDSLGFDLCCRVRIFPNLRDHPRSYPVYHTHLLKKKVRDHNVLVL
jgi:hypothetical protein